MHKKVCLSIPIHTALDVVQQHIENIFFFVKNSIVVLHVSADQSIDFYNQAKVLEQKYQDKVYVNNKRYSTHSPTENVVGLASVHASNYEYAKTQTCFDVFSCHASNEMFVRPGVENSYDNYCVGITSIEPGYPGPNGFNDALIIELQKYITVKDVYWGSVIEGAFFDTAIMQDVARVTLQMPRQPVPAEPLVFNTIALNLHNEKIKDSWTTRVTFTNASQNCTDEMIQNTMNARNPFYSIKSVPRNIKDPLRIKINKLLKTKYGAP